MTSRPPHILCINPWIHDFAAYDFWAKPLGLLYIASLLRSHGVRVSYIDCLDRFHPNAPHPGHTADGRGAYRKTPIQPPPPLSDIPATFSRYGIDPAWFDAGLAAAGRPDLVLVTSHMTYWYTGVRETITMVKNRYPGVPVLLGGIYASLLPGHARMNTGADAVVPGAGEKTIFGLIKHHTAFSVPTGLDLSDMNAFPYPAFDMQSAIPYVPLLTARGCPNRCAYCASHVLQPHRCTRDPENVVAEIAFWHKHFGVDKFAFYDDALLSDAEAHAMPILEALGAMEGDLSFHTPNAIHVRPVTPAVAKAMYAAGFKTIRLGVETTDDNRREFDNKASRNEFVRAASALLDAGFAADQLGAYLLVGLPGQDMDAVEASIDAVKETGIKPVLAYYTPIPRTRMWEAACAASRYDLAAEPLFTNNSLMPCMSRYDRRLINRLKQRVRA